MLSFALKMWVSCPAEGFLPGMVESSGSRIVFLGCGTVSSGGRVSEHGSECEEEPHGVEEGDEGDIVRIWMACSV
jgi:hypothetical protein